MDEEKRGRGRPAGSKNKKTIEQENREAFENGTNFKPEDSADENSVLDLPYKTPKELHDKMLEYFDQCRGGDEENWREIIQEFAELDAVMKEHPTWSNHQRSYERIAQKIRNTGVFPDEAGMRMYLGLTHEAYKAYKDAPEFESVFNWAQDMRESWAARKMAADPKSASAYLAILKQPGNGGWVDRKADTGDKTLVVKTSGVGGISAFK